MVDKTTQTWAAYEAGRLVRWGPSSTGAAATPTPSGRFTMKWRAMERESTEAPPGETWAMRYVMNIHEGRGIHLHQYDVVPTGPPEGHGCIRMVMSDAQWLWNWSDGWQTTAGPGAPERFVMRPYGPIRVLVLLPPDPMALPRGDR